MFVKLFKDLPVHWYHPFLSMIIAEILAFSRHNPQQRNRCPSGKNGENAKYPGDDGWWPIQPENRERTGERFKPQGI